DDAAKTRGEALANTAIAYIKERTPADAGAEENRNAALNHWFFVADLHDSAQRPDKVEETYEQIIKIFGAADDVLTRYGQWHLSQKQFDKARSIYGRFENKIKGTELVAASYVQVGQLDAAVLTYRNLSAMDPDNELAWIERIARTYDLDQFRQYAK